MTCRTWLRKKNLYDKDIEEVLTEEDVTNPEEDFKTFTQKQWNKVYRKINVERAKELKDTQARNRLKQKLNKLEKEWRSISGIKKSIGGTSGKKTKTKSKTKSSEPKSAPKLKKWMQKEEVWEKELYDLLIENGLTCSDDLILIASQESFDNIIRQVKVAKKKDLKDTQASNRLDKKLTKFEKLWRSKTGLKKSIGGIKNPNKTEEKKENELDSAPDLKKWMQKEEVWEKELYDELRRQHITCYDDLILIASLESYNEIKRKVTTKRNEDLKDQQSKNRLQAKLTKFEKLWRDKTGIKNTMQQSKN